MLPDALLLFLRSNAFKYVLVIILMAGCYYAIYRQGENHVQAQWDAANIKTNEEIARLKAESGKVTTKVVTEYVDRVKKVTVKGDTIVKYVDKYITVDSDKNCIIPKNYVLIHDSAVRNIVLPEGSTK